MEPKKAITYYNVKVTLIYKYHFREVLYFYCISMLYIKREQRVLVCVWNHEITIHASKITVKVMFKQRLKLLILNLNNPCNDHFTKYHLYVLI